MNMDNTDAQLAKRQKLIFAMMKMQEAAENKTIHRWNGDNRNNNRGKALELVAGNRIHATHLAATRAKDKRDVVTRTAALAKRPAT